MCLVPNWGDIRKHKKQLINTDNQNENKYHKLHIYKVRGKVLVRDNK